MLDMEPNLSRGQIFDVTAKRGSDDVASARSREQSTSNYPVKK
jgi:hypothetical protein